MLKRLFLAFSLPQDFLKYLEAYKMHVAPENKLRWVPRQNLHITLYFIGDTVEKTIPDLVNYLDDKSRNFKAFDLKSQSILIAPKRQPYMVWSLFEPSSGYLSIYQEIVPYFTDLIPTNPKIHCTLARYKKGMSIALPEFEPYVVPIRITELVLYESVLKPTGAVYMPLKKFTLK